MKTFSAYCSPEVTAAFKEALPDFYEMSLGSPDAAAVTAAVNRGIDAHLEACFVPDRGDSYELGRKLVCRVSRESMLVLCRRLMETDEGTDLVSSIASTLDIELV